MPSYTNYGRRLLKSCPKAGEHTPAPRGFVAWRVWAEQMEKRHRQVQCGECGRYEIWVRKGNA